MKKTLIEKNNGTYDPVVLEEAYRLFKIETEDMEVYKLTDEQKRAIHESQDQIKNGDFLTNDQVNKEIDE